MENHSKENNSILDIAVFLIFLLVYELSATIYSLPNNDILRWVVCSLLVLVDIALSMTTNGGRFILLPREFLYLVYPLFIQSFWNFEQIGIALSRSLSFVLYCMAIASIFHRRYMTSGRIKKMFYVFFAVSILLILPLNMAAINRTSMGGDYLGIYNNRNMTTSVMMSIFVMLGIALKLGPERKKIINIVIIFLMIISVYLNFLTHSRMAIIGLAVAFFMLWYYSSTRKNGLRVIIIGMLAVVTLYFLPSIGKKFGITSVIRIFSAQVLNGSTGFFRNDLWDLFIGLVRQKPLFGWGNNSVYYNTFVNPQESNWGVHNSYYVMLIEGGITGTICYALFFFSMFRRCLKDYRTCMSLGMDKDSILLVRYCFITCITLGINAFAESFLFSAGNVLSLPFWFSLIGCRVFLQQKKSELIVREGMGSAT